MQWGRENYEDFPWRSTTNPFHALLAEVMLQRTRAEQVVPIYRKFALLYQSSREASEEDPDKIRSLLVNLGLRWRIEKIIELIHILDDRGGSVPTNLEELLNLPGVGQYAASSYLSLHAGVRMPIIDSNVVRLWSRVFFFKTDTEIRRKQWFLDFVDKTTPKENFKGFNYAVLDFTRKVCRPKPLHNVCPITSVCRYYRENYR